MEVSDLAVLAMFVINFGIVLFLAMECDYYNRIWWPLGYGLPRGRFYISPSTLALSLFTGLIPGVGPLIALPFWAMAKEQFDEMSPSERALRIAEGNERAKNQLNLRRQSDGSKSDYLSKQSR